MSMLTMGKFIVVFKATAVITDLPTNKCPFLYRVFGDQILKLFCNRNNHKREEETPHDCVYNLLYRGKKVNSDSYVPPFIIECDNTKTTLVPGEYFEVIFTIASPSSFWHKLIPIWKKMAEEGLTEEPNTIKLVSIKLSNPIIDETKIIATSTDFSPALPKKLLITEEQIVNYGDKLGGDTKIRHIKIDFLTPWQFHRRETGEDQQLRSSVIIFSDVITGLYIRALSIATSWGENGGKLAIQELKELAKRLDTEEDSFRRVVDYRDSRGGKHRSGITGSMTVESGQQITKFLPLLIFGEIMHIGRGCAAGHGRMKFSLV